MSRKFFEILKIYGKAYTMTKRGLSSEIINFNYLNGTLLLTIFPFSLAYPFSIIKEDGRTCIDSEIGVFLKFVHFQPFDGAQSKASQIRLLQVPSERLFTLPEGRNSSKQTENSSSFNLYEIHPAWLLQVILLSFDFQRSFCPLSKTKSHE
jgi:hypothetical protein